MTNLKNLKWGWKGLKENYIVYGYYLSLKVFLRSYWKLVDEYKHLHILKLMFDYDIVGYNLNKVQTFYCIISYIFLCFILSDSLLLLQHQPI